MNIKRGDIYYVTNTVAHPMLHKYGHEVPGKGTEVRVVGIEEDNVVKETIYRVEWFSLFGPHRTWLVKGNLLSSTKQSRMPSWL